MEKPVIIDKSSHDEDDDADLFSFGLEDVTEIVFDENAVATASSSSGIRPTTATTGLHEGQLEGQYASTRERTGSTDSFINFLQSETTSSTTQVFSSTQSAHPVLLHDKETQAILDWLEEDDVVVFAQNQNANLEPETEESGMVVPPTIDVGVVNTKVDDTGATTQSADPKSTQTTDSSAAAMHVQPQETIVVLPPVFTSLSEALQSPLASHRQIRDLALKEIERKPPLNLTELRPELYCRLIFGKSLDDTQSCSLADSFEHWNVSKIPPSPLQDLLSAWVVEQAKDYAISVAVETKHPLEGVQANLEKILLFHFNSNRPVGEARQLDHDSEKENSSWKDPLIPPVASAILTTGLPVTAASVLLTKIVPQFMPLLALRPEERWEAAMFLHTELYSLATYHQPYLVLHLDRHLPGWYWPKIPSPASSSSTFISGDEAISATELGRNLKKRGQIPPSWLLSHLAGECESEGDQLPAKHVLELWDRIFTADNNAMRFFLTLAVLNDATERLLLLTGDVLLSEVRSVFELQSLKTSTDPVSSTIGDWWSRARTLQAATPESVVTKLKHAEDDAIQQALKQRQQRAEAELKARLEAEAAAHKEEQERKANEARERLTRARLVAFYRKNAPDKESHVDLIMKTYAGRYEVLDSKLKQKYGEGFNPALKDAPIAKRQGNPGSSTNQGTRLSKSEVSEDANGHETESKTVRVSVLVPPAEVLPIVCWSKEAASARGANSPRSRKGNRQHLKFYLVDSRSESAVAEQGKFPTAATLSPEAMMDPDRMKRCEELVESLRGAVHLVIMGEGFSALPKLYTQRLSSDIEELMRDDESRTNMCALFFVKRGFPFVSILDGGFAAAHSWLVRQGPNHHLSVSAVLVDYNPARSLFGQMETYHNASSTEKAQRTMQNLLESSVAEMAKRSQQLERLASDIDAKEVRQAISLGFLGLNWPKADASKADTTEKNAGVSGQRAAVPSSDDVPPSAMRPSPVTAAKKTMSVAATALNVTSAKPTSGAKATANGSKAQPSLNASKPFVAGVRSTWAGLNQLRVTMSRGGVRPAAPSGSAGGGEQSEQSESISFNGTINSTRPVPPPSIEANTTTSVSSVSTADVERV